MTNHLPVSSSKGCLLDGVRVFLHTFTDEEDPYHIKRDNFRWVPSHRPPFRFLLRVEYFSERPKRFLQNSIVLLIV